MTWHDAAALPVCPAGQRHLRTAVLDRSYLQAVNLQEARKRFRCTHPCLHACVQLLGTRAAWFQASPRSLYSRCPACCAQARPSCTCLTVMHCSACLQLFEICTVCLIPVHDPM